MNSNTHWLDASTVYGSTNAAMTSLRQFTGGLLKMTSDVVNKRQLLPISSPCTNNACFLCGKSLKWFNRIPIIAFIIIKIAIIYAGDSRCTEQPQLTVMHTLWAREHNRIANTLVTLNPTWNDETVFQEARRIVIAEIQHITYKEFIPNLISKFRYKYELSQFFQNENW